MQSHRRKNGLFCIHVPVCLYLSCKSCDTAVSGDVDLPPVRELEEGLVVAVPLQLAILATQKRRKVKPLTVQSEKQKSVSVRELFGKVCV